MKPLRTRSRSRSRVVLVFAAPAMFACASTSPVHEGPPRPLVTAHADPAEPKHAAPSPPAPTEALRPSNQTVTHEPRSREATQQSEQACSAEQDLPSCHGAALDHYYRKNEDEDVRAFELFRRACDAGYAPSCNGVGTMIAEGRGAAKDLAVAARFYHRACAGDGATGCEHLSNAFEAGHGVTKDAAKAKSAHARGRCLVAQSLSKKPDPAKCPPLAPLP
ncbi:MAG: tetratricopeptide repeat protein [Polyangiaceae bacterium]